MFFRHINNAMNKYLRRQKELRSTRQRYGPFLKPPDSKMKRTRGRWKPEQITLSCFLLHMIFGMSIIMEQLQHMKLSDGMESYPFNSLMSSCLFWRYVFSFVRNLERMVYIAWEATLPGNAMPLIPLWCCMTTHPVKKRCRSSSSKSGYWNEQGIWTDVYYFYFGARQNPFCTTSAKSKYWKD